MMKLRTKNTSRAKVRAARESVVAQRALPMREFSRSLPMALLRAREAVMRQFRPALRVQGVTEQQWRILRALAHSGPIEVTALADATCLLAPSLSRILPELEARGFISRKQLKNDRRRGVISLESAGLKLIAAHAPDSEGVYHQIEAAFGKQRLEQLLLLLQELEESLAEPQ
jgi:homoprotocatechuate degradation regulator HpaR